MTTVKDILAMPIGQGTGGYDLTVKVSKKAWEVEGTWYQRLMLTDGTDEILAEVKLTSNLPIQRNIPIHIIVGKRVERDVNNKEVPCLYIDQWSDPRTPISEPDESDPWGKSQEWWDERNEKVIRGKCKTLFIMHFIGAVSREYGEVPEPKVQDIERIEKWADIACTPTSINSTPTSSSDSAGT